MCHEAYTKRYVLCDSTKFHQTSPVSFGEFLLASVITDRIPEGLKNTDKYYCGSINTAVLRIFISRDD